LEWVGFMGGVPKNVDGWTFEPESRTTREAATGWGRANTGGEETPGGKGIRRLRLSQPMKEKERGEEDDEGDGKLQGKLKTWSKVCSEKKRETLKVRE